MAIGDDRDPVNPSPPAWHENSLLVLGRAHELHVAHSERRRQLIEAHHRRVATTSLSSESARELADLRMLEPSLDDTPTLEAHPEHDPVATSSVRDTFPAAFRVDNPLALFCTALRLSRPILISRLPINNFFWSNSC
jgi:hypothetical protein